MTKRRGQHLPDDGPSEADLDRFGGVTRTCPECKTEVYDEAELCWKCGHAFSNAAGSPPKWVWITAAALLVAFVVFMILR